MRKSETEVSLGSREVRVASLGDLVSMKQAMLRPKDVPELAELLDLRKLPRASRARTLLGERQAGVVQWRPMAVKAYRQRSHASRHHLPRFSGRRACSARLSAIISLCDVAVTTHDLDEAITLSDEVVVLTAAPGRIKASYAIELPRPRNVAEVRFEPRFGSLYEQIWHDLRDEALLSYRRGPETAVKG